VKSERAAAGRGLLSIWLTNSVKAHNLNWEDALIGDERAKRLLRDQATSESARASPSHLLALM
jgi:hypothetical protein